LQKTKYENTNLNTQQIEKDFDKGIMIAQEQVDKEGRKLGVNAIISEEINPDIEVYGELRDGKTLVLKQYQDNPARYRLALSDFSLDDFINIDQLNTEIQRAETVEEAPQQLKIIHKVL
jgi:hypothetical protein